MYGRKIKAIRQMIGFNQTQMAQAAGMSQRDISLLENGRKTFIPNEMMTFLSTQEIDLNWLFNEEAVTDEDMRLAYRKFAGAASPLKEGRPVKPREKIIKMIDADELMEYPYQKENDAYLEGQPALALPWTEYRQFLYRAFQADSDAMTDLIEPNDYVLARAYELPLNPKTLRIGRAHVFVTGNEVIIGRLAQVESEKILIDFENQAYAQRVVKIAEITELWWIRAKLSHSITGQKTRMLGAITGLKQQVDSILDRLKQPLAEGSDSETTE